MDTRRKTQAIDNGRKQSARGGPRRGGPAMRTAPGAGVMCFGEILWDCLPRGIFLGGAPLNAAYHLSRQGVRVDPVSAVGRDFLGGEALRRIAAWGIGGRFIARSAQRKTGTVRASLDPAGAATYRFAPGVAWDSIPVAAVLRRPAPAAIVYGTLALRSGGNRRALARLLVAWPNALRVLDLNLRAPFDRRAAVGAALRHAQIVKLNDEELGRMVGARRAPAVSGLEKAARKFAAAHRLAVVCVTAGARGAGLLLDGVWYWAAGRPVRVRDTVGAGDAFLAALLAGLLVRRVSPPTALAAACRMGEFVAARDGATPPYRCDGRGRPREAAR